MKIFNKSGLGVVFVVASMLSIAGLVFAATISLGTSNTFAILAGSGITITGAVNTSTVTGDIGTSPTPAITGLASLVLNGVNHADDASTIAAKIDLVTAYDLAASSTPVTIIPTELGGTTNVAGVYLSPSGTFEVTGTTTLDGQGDPNAVFIFQATSTLVTAGASHVSLINGAQACHVFWQVGSSATLGGGSLFKGNILALTSISLGGGAEVEGRLFAQNGAVTLDTNTITLPVCGAMLHVVTEVINTGGGTAIPSDFTLHVATGTPSVDIPASPQSGVIVPGSSYVLSPNTYLVSEDATTTYTQSFSADCPLGAITLISGDNKTCTVTNTYNVPAPAPVPAPVSVSSSGASYSNSYFLYPKPTIKIVKIPTPLSLPEGPNVVVYDYYVSNTGTVPMSNIMITDNKCTSIYFVSGDSNGDTKLDVNELWRYACSMKLTETTTNIATVSGHADSITATDTTYATVVVTLPVVATQTPMVLGASTTTVPMTVTSYPTLPDAGYAPQESVFPWGAILAICSIFMTSWAFVTTGNKIYFSSRKV
jgi:hypothetical protein